jgi:hypothetical protein
MLCKSPERLDLAHFNDQVCITSVLYERLKASIILNSLSAVCEAFCGHSNACWKSSSPLTPGDLGGFEREAEKPDKFPWLECNEGQLRGMGRGKD